MRVFAAGLLVLLSACAGPDIRRSEGGDYWLGGHGAYVGSVYSVYGGYPWWYHGGPYYGPAWHPTPLAFHYYSRNFYPHHFSVLYPSWPAYHPAWRGSYPLWGPVHHGWGHPHRDAGPIGDRHDRGSHPVPPAAAPQPPLTVIPPSAGFARGSERAYRRHGITPTGPQPNTGAVPIVGPAVGTSQGRMAELPSRVPQFRPRGLSAAPGAVPVPAVRPAVTRPAAPGSVGRGVNRKAPDIPRR
jgi:hypothetical protein